MSEPTLVSVIDGPMPQVNMAFRALRNGTHLCWASLSRPDDDGRVRALLVSCGATHWTYGDPAIEEMLEDAAQELAGWTLEGASAREPLGFFCTTGNPEILNDRAKGRRFAMPPETPQVPRVDRPHYRKLERKRKGSKYR